MDEFIFEITSVLPSPVSLKMLDSINCPICDIDLTDELQIDLDKFEVDNDTTIHCENCDIVIKFEVVKI